MVHLLPLAAMHMLHSGGGCECFEVHRNHGGLSALFWKHHLQRLLDSANGTCNPASLVNEWPPNRYDDFLQKRL